jgi:hypothetical protein
LDSRVKEDIDQIWQAICGYDGSFLVCDNTVGYVVELVIDVVDSPIIGDSWSQAILDDIENIKSSLIANHLAILDNRVVA